MDGLAHPAVIGALSDSSVAPVTWSGNITLTGNTTFSSRAISTLSISDYGGLPFPTPSGTNSAPLTITGNIGGTGSITKTGSGALLLEGLVTTTGPLTVTLGGADVRRPGRLTSRPPRPASRPPRPAPTPCKR